MLLWLPSILVAAAVQTSPLPDCSLQHLDRCRNTNLLIWDKTFQWNIERFLGAGRVNYLYPGPLAEQQIAVLGGPPDEPTRVGELYRFTACRHHSCDEKGAVFLEPNGRIVASAILHSRCGERPNPRDCPRRRVLSVFLRDPATAGAIFDNVEAWARAHVAEAGVSPGFPRDGLDRVDVFSVARGKPEPVKRP